MSAALPSVTPHATPVSTPETPTQDRGLLDTAGKVAKVIAAVVAAIAAVGLLAIGITFTPFFPAAGAGALALSAALFAVAGRFFFNTSST